MATNQKTSPEFFSCSTLSHHDFVLFHFTEQKNTPWVSLHHSLTSPLCEAFCHTWGCKESSGERNNLVWHNAFYYSTELVFVMLQIMSLVLANDHICFLALFLGRIWPRSEAHGHNLQTQSRSIRNPTATEQDFKEMDENRAFGSADRGSRLSHRYSGCADALRMII